MRFWSILTSVLQLSTRMLVVIQNTSFNNIYIFKTHLQICLQEWESFKYFFRIRLYAILLRELSMRTSLAEEKVAVSEKYVVSDGSATLATSTCALHVFLIKFRITRIIIDLIATRKTGFLLRKHSWLLNSNFINFVYA